MAQDDRRKNLYQTMQKENVEMPDFETFCSDLEDESIRDWYFNKLKEKGYSPDRKEFDEAMTGHGSATMQEPKTPLAPPSYTEKQKGFMDYAMAGNAKPQRYMMEVDAKGGESGVNDFKKEMDASMKSLNKQHESNMSKLESARNASRFGSSAELKFNTNTGKLEEQYRTSTGELVSTPMEKSAIDRSVSSEAEVSDDMKAAYEDLDRINGEIQRRSKEIDESNPTSFATGLASTEPGYDYSMSARINDPELQMLWTAKRSAEDRVKTLEREKFNEGFFKTIGKGLFSQDNWDFGIFDLIDARNKSQYGEAKLQGKALNEAKNTMLESEYESNVAQAKYGENDTFLQRAGDITAQAIPFVAEFLTTGGFSGLTTAGTKAGAKVATKIGLKEGGNKAMQAGRFIVKNTGTLAGDFAAGMVMANTTGAAKVASDMINMHQGQVIKDEEGNLVFDGGKSWGRSAYEAEVSNILEYFTEMLGAHVDKLGSKLLKDGLGASKISDFFSRVSMGKFAKALKYGGVNDYPSEVMEEEINLVLSHLLVDMTDKDNDTTWKEAMLGKDGNTQLDIVGGMALSIGFMRAPAAAIDGATYYKYKHDVSKYDSVCGSVFGDKWEQLRDRIDQTTNDNMKDVWEDVNSDNSISLSAKESASNYIKSLMTFRGFNLGTAAMAKDKVAAIGTEEEEPAEANSAEQRIAESYARGENASTPEEQRDIFIASVMAEEGTQEAAEARAAYDGMVEKAYSDIDANLAVKQAQLAQITNEDGNVYLVNMKETDEDGNPKKGYLVKGNVDMYEDGSGVDRQNSDKTVNIFSVEQNKVIMVDPAADTGITSIELLGTAEDVNKEYESAAEAARKEKDDAFKGVVSFKPNDVFVGANGNRGVVVGADAEKVNVVFADGSQEEYSMKELQRIADEASYAGYVMRHGVNAGSEDDVAQEEAAVADNEPAEPVEEAEQPEVEAESADDDAMPMDENGKPAYLQSTPERGHRYVYVDRALPKDVADKFVGNNIKESEKVLKGVVKNEPEIGTDIDEYEMQHAEWSASVAAAQAAVDYWNGVKAVEDARVEAENAAKKDLEAKAAEIKAEAEKKIEEEKAESEKKRALVGIENDIRSAIAHNPEMVDNTMPEISKAVPKELLDLVDKDDIKKIWDNVVEEVKNFDYSKAKYNPGDVVEFKGKSYTIGGTITNNGKIPYYKLSDKDDFNSFNGFIDLPETAIINVKKVNTPKLDDVFNVGEKVLFDGNQYDVVKKFENDNSAYYEISNEYGSIVVGGSLLSNVEADEEAAKPAADATGAGAVDEGEDKYAKAEKYGYDDIMRTVENGREYTREELEKGIKEAKEVAKKFRSGKIHADDGDQELSARTLDGWVKAYEELLTKYYDGKLVKAESEGYETAKRNIIEVGAFPSGLENAVKQVTDLINRTKSAKQVKKYEGFLRAHNERIEEYKKLPVCIYGYRAGDTFKDKAGNYIILARYNEEGRSSGIMWKYDKNGKLIGSDNAFGEKVSKNVSSGKWTPVQPVENESIRKKHTKAVQLTLDVLNNRERNAEMDEDNEINDLIANAESNKSDPKDTAETNSSNDVSKSTAEPIEEDAGPVSYSVSPSTYTTKRGKVLEMQLVKFDRDLTASEQAAAKDIAKADKGWWSVKDGGFLMRSAESAENLGKAIAKGGDAVENEQPVSLADVKSEAEGPFARIKDYIDNRGALFYIQYTEKGRKQYRCMLDDRNITTIVSKKEYDWALEHGGKTISEAEQNDITDNSELSRLLDWFHYNYPHREPEEVAKAIVDSNNKLAKENNLPKIKRLIDLMAGDRGRLRRLSTDGEAYNEKKEEAPKADSVVKQVDVMGLMGALKQNGVAKLSDHATPVENNEPKRLVSDERMDELKEKLRKKLRGQLNVGVDPEMLAIGAELAVGHIERGVTKFADYAKQMIDDIGDAIRPYLKSFYNAVRDMPEAAYYADQMDNYADVSEFDVQNFDKEGAKDIVAAAQHVLDEQKVEEDVAAVEKEIKEKRNAAKDEEEYQPATAEDVEAGEELYMDGKIVHPMVVFHNEKDEIDDILLTNGNHVTVEQLQVLKDIEENPLPDEENFVSLQSKENLENGEGRRENADKFVEGVAEKIYAVMDEPMSSMPFKNIIDVRKYAAECGMDVDMEGRDDIMLQELVEDAIVRIGKRILATPLPEGKNKRWYFEQIASIEYHQPSINARSSNRIAMGQYSTPIVMSYVADLFVQNGTPNASVGRVLEPTAGNGMLVFGIHAADVHANELDKTRLLNLKGQGFAEVTNKDATLPFEGGKIYDAVVANPPFGTAKTKMYDGKAISSIDQQIALNALESMKDDGRAAIIIGGNMEYAKNGSVSDHKAFWSYLYDHYNVKGVVDINGLMFAKQGTKFPTRMIFIEGRRSEEERAQSTVYPPVEANAFRKANNVVELYNTLTHILNDNSKTNGTEILRSGAGQPASDVKRPAGSSDRRAGDKESSSNAGSSVRAEREGSSRVERAEKQGSRSVLGESRQDAAAGTGESAARADRGEVRTDERGAVAGDAASDRRVDNERVRGSRDRVENQEQRTLTSDKLPYRQHNTAFSLESVAPASMVEAMDKTLSRIEDMYGDIDRFVSIELGYESIEDMHNALAAEQVDSVAMAIAQMKEGKAFVIGDQTGVGKGRQMAALIRYAHMQGKKPVFFTQKADLFSDLYRDMVDTGSGDLNPFIVNADGAIVEKKGGETKTVFAPLSAAKQKEVFASGKIPEEYDYVVVTYSQVNTGDAQSKKEYVESAKEDGGFVTKKDKEGPSRPTPKATWIRSIVNDNYLFMDESHTGAGQSNTGYYMQSIQKGAKAVTYASATFAKRPDTMPLYAMRTAMSEANVPTKDLIGIIEKGGVTLQEIMSRALTDAGQMVRRERDMSDVKTDWKTIDNPEIVKKSRENYDKTIKVFNDIIEFQEMYVNPMIERQSSELATMMSTASKKKGTNKMGIANIPFASKIYNYTKQLMLALKVDAIVEEVDAEIKAGRHPVIALESTMESAYKDFVGEELPDASFAASMLKGLDSTMKYTVTDAEGKEQHYSYDPSELGEEGEKAYYELHDMIREATSDIFISPIDMIIEGLREKGYKVGELTGRNSYVERRADGKVEVKRRTDRDKKKLQAAFNDGSLDVLILNKSASTGISLHASEKFEDKRQRSMIIAQPLSDINDYMQMIGRIDRTGQVHRGYYINLGLPVPAENRFLMMLSTKLKSLNANTSSSQENKGSDVEAPDLLNKYGSQVIVEYLRDNRAIYEKMGNPLKVESFASLEDYKASEDDARKVTGYVALLSTDEQEAFYNDVVQRYADLIKYLDDTGSNDLKITVMPLKAETIERKVSSEGVNPGGSNPFAQNAYVEKVTMDVLRKPMKSGEVKSVIDNINGGKTGTERLGDLREALTESTNRKMEDEERRYENVKERNEETVSRYAEKVNAQEKLSADEKENAIKQKRADLMVKAEDVHSENVKKIRTLNDSMMRKLNGFVVGNTYLVPDDIESTRYSSVSPAIFCGFKAKLDKMTPSTTVAVFAVLDGRRRIEIKLNDSTPIDVIKQATMMNYDAASRTNLDNWDEQIPNGARKEGYIMTGNILQAVKDTQREDGSYPGQLVSYTDIEGNVHDGILMPDRWEPSMLKSSGKPIMAALEDIKNMDARPGSSIISTDGEVRISRLNPWSSDYVLEVPKSKKTGGKYFENENILALVKGNNFYQRAGKFRGDVPAWAIEDLVRELSNIGVRVESKKESKKFLLSTYGNEEKVVNEENTSNNGKDYKKNRVEDVQRGGLVKDEAARRALTEERIRLLDTIGRDLGVTFRIGEIPEGGAFYNSERREIVINERSIDKKGDFTMTLEAIVGHELTHHVKEYSKNNKQLWDSFVKILRTSPVYNRLYNRHEKIYHDAYNRGIISSYPTTRYLEEETCSTLFGAYIFSNDVKYAVDFIDNVYHSGDNVVKKYIHEILKKAKEIIDRIANSIINHTGSVSIDETLKSAYDVWNAMAAQVIANDMAYYGESDIASAKRLLPLFNTIFESNAAVAVASIKQEKATPEQWLAMLQKNGGLKAGEDKWIGLSDWLKERSADAKRTGANTITKDEVLQYISDNKIEIEEVDYGENGLLTDQQLDDFYDELPQEIDRFHSNIQDEFEDLKDGGMSFEEAYNAMVEKYGDDFAEAYPIEDQDPDDYIQWSYTDPLMRLAGVKSGEDSVEENILSINPTRLTYTTKGLTNKREIALVVPTIEPYNQNDETHFGDAGDGRAVAWVRFGDATDAEGNKVLVIDEIQSKRHQDGREKGYASNWKIYRKQYEEYKKMLSDKYNSVLDWSEEELKRFNELIDLSIKSKNSLVPDAPFDKNWHELVMKRVLRLAAEEGYDKVAWTTGRQQAVRYDIGSVVDEIWNMNGYENTGQAKYNLQKNGNSLGSIIVDTESRIVVYGTGSFGDINEETPLSDVVGKELATKMLGTEPGSKIDLKNEVVGGEGMKGFYDQILPRFMDKYCKKWGVKTGTVTLDLPNKADRVMHSVDVTDAMKESVMEGQLMFRTSDELDNTNPGWREQNTTSGGHSTQIKGTLSTYKKIGDFLRGEGENPTILDASSGFGHGTKALREMGFDVEDVEPYPSDNREEAPTYTAYSDIDKKYDVVISNAVLNVIPDDWRDDVLKAMADKTNVGGRIIINVRGDKEIASQGVEGVTKETLDTPSEILVKNADGSYRAYQKGFSKRELKEYVERVLGEGWEVEIGNEKNSGISNGTVVVAKRLNGKPLKYRDGDYTRYPSYETRLKRARRSGYSKSQYDALLEREWDNMVNTANDIVEKLGMKDKVTFVERRDSLKGKKRTAKGWFDAKTGKVTIVLQNNTGADDVMKTIFHECVAHYGLRKMFGEYFDDFLVNVYNNCTPEVRGDILGIMFDKKIGLNEATEEYIAKVAEEDDYTKMDGFWIQIKMLFFEMLNKLGEAGMKIKNLIGKDEIRYLLWRSYENLVEPGRYNPIVIAKDVVMRDKCGMPQYEYDDDKMYMVSDNNDDTDPDGDGPRGGVPSSKDQTKSENFKRWFGDWENDPENASKVVDEEGKPIVVYKRMKDNHNVIDTREGSFFSDKPIDDEAFGAYVGKYYLNIRKPLILDARGTSWDYPMWRMLANEQEEMPSTKEEYESVLEERGLLNMAPKEVWDIVMDESMEVDFEDIPTIVKRMGLDYDGVVIKNIVEGSEHNQNLTDYVAFYPNQIKSTENYGTFGEEESDVRFREGESIDDRIVARGAYDDMLASTKYQFTEAWQDSMLGLKKLYEAVLGDVKIEDVSDYENAYMAENRMSSMNNAQMNIYKEDFMRPIAREVRRLTGGNKEAYQALLDYMMAKHGLERNEVMARRDAAKITENKFGKDYSDLRNLVDTEPENEEYRHDLEKLVKEIRDYQESVYEGLRKKDYAGLTALTDNHDVKEAEEAAYEMVNEYEYSHDTEELWRLVNRATNKSLSKLYESGLMSLERYNEIRGMYDYYIPLQGFDEKVAEDEYSYIGSDGTLGYGTPIRKAKGRKSKADDPLATIAMNADASIRQGNRNLMKQRFLNFVQAHPSDLVSVEDAWLKKNDVTGEWEYYFDADLRENDNPDEIERKVVEFEEKMQQLASEDPDHYKKSRELPNVPYRVVEQKDMKQHQVLVKRNGVQFVLTINGNPRAAQALNGLTNPDTGSGLFEWIEKNLMKAVRWLSLVRTSMSPEFIESNFLRDAIYSNSMAWVKEGTNYSLKFHENFGKVNPAFLAEMYREWNNGSLRDKVRKLRYNQDNIGKVDQMRIYFDEFMTNGGETGWTQYLDLEANKKRLAKTIKEEGNEALKKIKALEGALQLLGNSVENTARFAAYVTSREMGRSIGRSVWDAKEISINFNKKGAGAKFYGSKSQTKLGNVLSLMSGIGRLFYMFFNAAVQSLSQIIRVGKAHPGKFSAVAGTLMSMGALAPILSMLIGGDDDDEYYNLPEYVRRTNICFRFDKDMDFITIPMSQEYRCFYGLGELTTSTVLGKEKYSDKDIATKYAEQFSQLLPLDFLEGKGGLYALAPDVIKQEFDISANVGWDGRPINRDNKFTENAPEWTRAFKSTNEQLVAFSKWLNELTGGDDYTKGSVDINPANLEYRLEYIFGGMASFPNKMIKTVETITGEREYDPRSIVFLSRVMKPASGNAESSKINSMYFNLQDEYEKTKYSYDNYKKRVDSGEDVIEYAERIDFLENSDAFKHYLVFSQYKPLVDKYNEMVKEADNEEESKAYKDAAKNMRAECVKMIYAIDEGEIENIDEALLQMLDSLIMDKNVPNDIADKAEKVEDKFYDWLDEHEK